MVCVTGVLVGIFSTLLILLVAGPFLAKWVMKRKASAVMEDVGNKMADFMGTEDNLNENKEEINGIKEDSQEKDYAN